MLRAIAAAKKKNDRIDASKICGCLRCDFLPESYMASTAIREQRRTLRYRNLLVRQMVQMKNKIGMLLAVNQEDFFGAQPARSCRLGDWGKERKLPMPPLICFEAGRNTQTQSSVQPERLRQQMEVWFYPEKEPRLRGQHTRRGIRKNLYPRSSKARRESFCPLDKDLSWKSWRSAWRAALKRAGLELRFPIRGTPVLQS